MDYYTVTERFSVETEEKRSRFIATLVPYVDFNATIAELRAEHKKANHHVSAVRYFNEADQIVELGKDDGEPSGTSGIPTLKTLIGAELVNVAVIVTRYFGGIKLGTGGLARAYSGASNAVIASASLTKWHKFTSFETWSAFADVSQVEALIAKTGVSVTDRIFETHGVRFKLHGPCEVKDLFQSSQ